MDGSTPQGTSKSSNATFFRQLITSFLKGLPNPKAKQKRHGNSQWKLFQVVSHAIFWRMSSEVNVTAAHEDAKKNCLQLFGFVGANSYPALMGILLTHSTALIAQLLSHLRAKVALDPNSRICGYFVLAVDGSKPSAPRTRSNERRFISKKYGKGKGARSRQRKREKNKKKAQKAKVSHPVPNVLITKFWNVALQLPWHWTIGGAETDERSEMAKSVAELDFPPETLLAADAGFVGYQLWKQILNKNLTFLIRAGANVHLMPKNKSKHLYYYRPNQFKRDPAIVVRLVYIKLGKTKMAMLTNELDPARLSKPTIESLYELRWGVEVDFRDFKQTFDCRKFRCKSADRVIVEADWSMMAFTLIKWLTYKHQSKRGVTWRRTSFALALQAFRRALNNHNNIDPPKQTLSHELCTAMLDDYKRKSSKTARYRPVGEKPATGLPKIKPINKKLRREIENTLRAAA